MSESSIEYAYQYPFSSSLATAADGGHLQLATSKQADQYPYFFEGKLLQPRTTAQLLFLLAKIVGTRFYMPPAMLKKIIAERDPVITSGGGVLRFEGFSACCSTYARVDLTPEAYVGTLTGTGTTNVDFNAPMKASLAAVRDQDRLSLSVGPDQVMLKRGFSEVIERKVQLPLRWIKGFVEVQAYQSTMQLRYTIGKSETIKFLRSLPANAHHRSNFFVVPSGQGLRLSQVESTGGIVVGGLERLALLKSVASLADELKIYASPNGESSEWQLRCGGISLHLTITAESSRGFSGEGQVLSDLAQPGLMQIAKVQAELSWQALLDVDQTALRCALTAATVKQSLSILGSRGLVGFDLANGAYFSRQMPFDMELVESVHPRLKAARKLVDSGDVKVLSKVGDAVEAQVKGTDVNHRVRIDSEREYCSCQWHSKYQGHRGPCKHILSVKLVAGMEE